MQFLRLSKETTDIKEQEEEFMASQLVNLFQSIILLLVLVQEKIRFVLGGFPRLMTWLDVSVDYHHNITSKRIKLLCYVTVASPHY